MINPSAAPFFSQLRSALSWPKDSGVLVVWIYYDESGEYADGNLLRMVIGGCAASYESWQAFDPKWRAALADEGLTVFHMSDFERWKRPFDFTLPDGTRDHVRHNRLLNRLLDLMIEHIDGLHGYMSHDVPDNRKKAHQAAMEQCMVGAISDAVKGLWGRYNQQPLNLVFAKQEHYKAPGREYWVSHYDSTDNRIGSCTSADIKNVPQLQAADIFAYECLRRFRIGRPANRYPYLRLQAGMHAKNGALSLQVGPFSPFLTRRRWPFSPRVPGQPS